MHIRRKFLKDPGKNFCWNFDRLKVYFLNYQKFFLVKMKNSGDFRRKMGKVFLFLSFCVFSDGLENVIWVGGGEETRKKALI